MYIKDANKSNQANICSHIEQTTKSSRCFRRKEQIESNHEETFDLFVCWHLWSPDTSWTTVTDGLSGRPITNRQCLQRLALTSLLAEWHHLLHESLHRKFGMLLSAPQHTYESSDSLAHCRPPCVEEVVPLQDTQQGLRRSAWELSYLVSLMTRMSGALLSWNYFMTKCCCRYIQGQVTPHTTAR